jgi:putative heme-binding domain-containing protein
MPMWKLLLIGIAGSLLPLLAQHEKEGEKKKHSFIGDPKEIAAGQKLFASGCAACHGVDGKGGRGPNLVERVFWHPLDEETLYKAVQKGIPAGGMPPANLPEDDAWRVVAYVKSLTAPAIETKAAGDPAAGEKVFWGKGGCGNCHALRGGRGGRLGPDLGNVAATRSVAHLFESILDPNADGAPGYRATTITLKDGREVKGVARNRTNYSLQLQDAQGKLHLISMGDVAKMSVAEGSPMPKDFGKRLTKTEVEDVVAFLARQTVRGEEVSSH